MKKEARWPEQEKKKESGRKERKLTHLKPGFLPPERAGV